MVSLASIFHSSCIFLILVDLFKHMKFVKITYNKPLYVQSVELTNEAIEFLRGIFDLFDNDGVCPYKIYPIFFWLFGATSSIQ